MKNIYSIVVFSFLVLLSVNFASARADFPNIQYNFAPDSGIDMNKIESLCTLENCLIHKSENWTQITFKLDYQDYHYYIVATKNNERTLLTIYTTEETNFDEIRNNPDKLKSFVSLGFNLLKDNNILYGISSQDIEDTSTLSTLDEIYNVLYVNSSSCGGNGWTKLTQIEGMCECYFLGYENSCPMTECSQPYEGECPLSSTGTSSNPEFESLSFLSLQTKTGSSSNLIYWIIGIALVLIIVLFLVFRKRK